MKKTIFIDGEGTLIEHSPSGIDTSEVQFRDGVIDGLSMLQSAGYTLVIVSNQSGIGKGLFSELDLKNLWQYLSSELIKDKILLDGFFYCPHNLEACRCKIPKPGLLFDASSKLGLELSQSWMLGDTLDDVEAGSRAGCSTILINSGQETEWRITEDRIPGYVTATFQDAARLILTSEQQEIITERKYVT